jgi:hypothetical protein
MVDDPGEIVPAEIEALKAKLEDMGRRLISVRRKALQEKLRREEVQSALDFAEKVLKGSQEGTTSIVGRIVTVGDMNINTGQSGAISRSAQARNMVFTRIWNQSK